MTEQISINLTKDEALVIFDFIVRFNQNENQNTLKDQAEQKVLWNIEVQLEKILNEPFKPNYNDLLKQARDKIRD